MTNSAIMSPMQEKSSVETRPNPAPPAVAPNVAVSCIRPFSELGDIISRYRAPKRPNRNRPNTSPASDGGQNADPSAISMVDLDRAAEESSGAWRDDTSWADGE